MFNALAHIDVAALFDDIINLRISVPILTMCIVFSSLGAVILGRFTGNFGNITFPLNFSALFIGTFITNGLFDGLDIPAIQYQQEVLMFTVAGMISASLGLMWLSGVRNT